MSARPPARTLGLMLRYAMVGLIVNAAGYAIYLLATWLGAGHKTTMSVLYAASAAAGYFGHRRYAFSYRGGVLGSFARYVVVHALGYGLNFALLAWFVDRLGYPHQWIQASAILVVTLFLFVAFRYFAFPASR